MKKDIAVMITILFITLASLVGSIIIVANLDDEKLEKIGIKNNPKFDDGTLIAKFNSSQKFRGCGIIDGADKTLNNSNFISLSIKKVKITPLAGTSIKSRMNLSFLFNDIQKKRKVLSKKIKLPEIHIFIDSPKKSSTKIATNQNLDFGEHQWDYHIILDRIENKIKVLNSLNETLNIGIDIFINEIEEKGKPVTRLTLGLPLHKIGDPEKGEWNLFLLSKNSNHNSYYDLIAGKNIIDNKALGIPITAFSFGEK